MPFRVHTRSADHGAEVLSVEVVGPGLTRPEPHGAWRGVSPPEAEWASEPGRFGNLLRRLDPWGTSTQIGASDPILITDQRRRVRRRPDEGSHQPGGEPPGSAGA